MFGFVAQCPGGGSGLFDHRGVLLGHAVHFVDSGVDLTQMHRLRLRGIGDAVDHRGHFANAFGNRAKHGAGFSYQGHPRTDLVGGTGDQGLDMVGGIGRALRQRAHFVGDHGKAAAGITCAGCFHAGIERQQVGLERNPVDHADDLADFLS